MDDTAVASPGQPVVIDVLANDLLPKPVLTLPPS